MNHKHPDTETEEMEDMAEAPATPRSISSNQPNHQMINDIVVDIKAIRLDREETTLSTTSCCIYRVPHLIREQNAEAYTPKIVSIGPFHYGNPKLQNMERHKHMFFKRFMERVETALDDLVSFVTNSEPKVRASYSENIILGKKELVKLILVDASFIIELFLGRFNDPNLKIPWLRNVILVDLILLENQLPFFFLEELFNQASLGDYLPSFRNLTFNFFSYFNRQNVEPNPNVDIKNFTDLLRTFHLQSFGRWKLHRQWFEVVGNHFLLYSANQLYEAGVKFKTNTSKCLLNLKFSGGVLEIPQIMVEDNTETLFRNMIALEQCQYPYESYITDYALVLDCLINTSKDVDILVHKEIICNYLADSSDVANLFNGLWKNITQMNFNSDYYDICKRLNGFYRDPWNSKKATLRRDYCKTPWQIAATVAGILLLVLTLVQTICSVIQET